MVENGESCAIEEAPAPASEGVPDRPFSGKLIVLAGEEEKAPAIAPMSELSPRSLGVLKLRLSRSTSMESNASKSLARAGDCKQETRRPQSAITAAKRDMAPWRVICDRAELRTYVESAGTSPAVRSDCGLGFMAWREALSEVTSLRWFVTGAPPEGFRIQGHIRIKHNFVGYYTENDAFLCGAVREGGIPVGYTLTAGQSDATRLHKSNVLGWARMGGQLGDTVLRVKNTESAANAIVTHRDNSWRFWKAIRGEPFYPRSLHVVVPERSVTGAECPVDLLMAYKRRLSCAYHTLVERPPTWDKARNVWMLPYEGRACKPADLNMQLVVCNDGDTEEAKARQPSFCLGLVADNVCTLDYEAPLSALQALTIALAVIERSDDVHFG